MRSKILAFQWKKQKILSHSARVFLYYLLWAHFVRASGRTRFAQRQKPGSRNGGRERGVYR